MHRVRCSFCGIFVACLCMTGLWECLLWCGWCNVEGSS